MGSTAEWKEQRKTKSMNCKTEQTEKQTEKQKKKNKIQGPVVLQKKV